MNGMAYGMGKEERERRDRERTATEAVKALALLVSGGVIGQASFGYHEFMISMDRMPCFEIIISIRK